VVAVLYTWRAVRARGRAARRVAAANDRERDAPRIEQGVVLGLFTAGGMFAERRATIHGASTSAFLTQCTRSSFPCGSRCAAENPAVASGSAARSCSRRRVPHFDWRALRFAAARWETLLCSVFFTMQILWLERKEFAGNNGVRLTLVGSRRKRRVLGRGGVRRAGCARAHRAVDFRAVLGLTILLTLFCTLAAFLLMNLWQPKITATEAG